MIWVAIMAGFMAGLTHVLSGPDHLAAVAPLAMNKGRRAWSAGLHWGLGHCGGVLVIGILAVAFRELFPVDALSSWAERFVGILLIAVGAWGICRILGARVGEPPGAAAFTVGVVHGFAGSSHLLGVVPALLFPSVAALCGYFAAFAVGTICGMLGFSSVLGLLPERLYRATLATSACAAIVIGGYWLIA